MANGTIAFDTLQTSDSVNTGTSKTLDTSYLYNGSAKYWVRFQGTGSGVRDSFNHTSITDHGTGSYSLVINNNMNNNK